MRHLSALLLALALGLPARAADTLLPAGAISGPAGVAPKGWQLPYGYGSGITVEEMDGAPVLRVQSAGGPDSTRYGELSMPVDWAHKQVRLSVTWRLSGFKAGPEGWHTARVLTLSLIHI
jgi:hypothetical protein